MGEENKTQKKKQITAEDVAKALVMLPKNVTYRIGDKCVSYELRITATDDGYEAYYWFKGVFTLSIDYTLYKTQGDNILKVIYELYEKVLQHGDLNQEVVNEVKCDTCTHAEEDCKKVYNVYNTTTCIK